MQAGQKKSKVLIIVPTISAGGSERFVSILFNQIDRSKFEVKLVVLDSSTLFYHLSYKEDIIFLNKKEVRSSFLILLKIIKKESPNIIFSTITSLNILLCFIRICYPKFLLIIRESTILSIHFKHVKNPFLYEIPIKMLYKFADKVICQSQDMLNDLHLNYLIKTDKLTVINNPALVEKFSPKINHPNKKPVLITVARLDKAKGYDRIIRSLALLSCDYEYVIVGDFTSGALRVGFDALVSDLGLGDKIKLIGISSKPEAFLQTADLYLHGSYYEGFPNVLLEAGLVGLPVISFDTAGIKEILVDKVSALIVPDNDLKAFAEAIDEGLKTNFDGARIRELISSRFDSKIIIEEYQTLFDSLIADSQKTLVANR